ncbi:unnamed protein product [Vitrella brassicaformis CCMP3155]|uniref:Uncharacterized protein n=2 Tax=Vitrella brassicaformis TaxID=1169539 RepID=A0A0G4H518_VITBC|nr:unnamed protein product [Vitrella brassicaformis CCMP3155]|eukprot:CEM38887.1 unnamed protein product [Vitrella brassicaformis CCMP3155]
MGSQATKMSGAAAAGGGGGSVADEPSSSAASAANGAARASSANQQQHQRTIDASHVPQDLAPTVAECVRSYSQLEALIDAHPTQFTAAVLLPILTRLLPGVVAAIFGGMVEVPLPQLALEVAASMTSPHRSAVSRALLLLAMRLLGVLLPIVGLGSFLMRIIPQLPLPQSLSHGCRIAVAIERLTRRLKRLERGGDWARWKPHLEMLYLLRGKRPVVLGDEHFDAFSSWAAIIGEREAVRQWKVLSRGVTVDHNGQQRQLMDGDGILFDLSYYVPALLASASRLFPHHTFDPADPPTELGSATYPSYTSMVAFELFFRLRDGHFPRYIREFQSHRSASAASQRVCELLAASPSDETQWGAGAIVFDKQYSDGGGQVRRVVFGSEVIGEGHMVAIQLCEWGHSRDVITYSTESAPHDKTRNVVMRVMGEHLEGKVWRGERER